MCGCSVRESPPIGTSQVLLVDFSKSFAPLTKSDEQAIRKIADATADLARGEWTNPVSVLWSRIQTASLVSGPVCRPLEFQQTLIKQDKSDPSSNLTDFDGFKQALQQCAISAAQQSSAPAEQASYTDISGALALASE